MRTYVPLRRRLTGRLMSMPGAIALVIAALAGPARADTINLETIFRFDSVDSKRTPIGTQLGLRDPNPKFPRPIVYGTLRAPAGLGPQAYALAQNPDGSWGFGTLTTDGTGDPPDKLDSYYFGASIRVVCPCLVQCGIRSTR